MKFTFTEKRMDSSEDLRNYAMRKIGKLDALFFGKRMRARHQKLQMDVRDKFKGELFIMEKIFIIAVKGLLIAHDAEVAVLLCNGGDGLRGVGLLIENLRRAG